MNTVESVWKYLNIFDSDCIVLYFTCSWIQLNSLDLNVM